MLIFKAARQLTLRPNNLVDFRDGTRGVQKQPTGSETAAQVRYELKPNQLSPKEVPSNLQHTDLSFANGSASQRAYKYN